MQDRFRFRVWNKDLYSTEPHPRMIYGVEQTYDCCCENDNKIPASSFGDVIDDEDFILMQCTGLKDKNGKLIYEGDIIKFVYEMIEFIGYISFCEDEACFNVECRENYISLCWSREFEVIGNIYENKELLEK